jgi:hypothetical protein
MSQDLNTKESKSPPPASMPKWQRSLIVKFRWTVGLLLFTNFMIFWAVPVFVQVSAKCDLSFFCGD